jgi:hypothetical protein
MRDIRRYPLFASSLRTLAVQFLQPTTKTQTRPRRAFVAERIAVYFSAAARAYTTIPTQATDDMETVDTSGRLSVLRTLMKERKIDVYGTHSSERSGSYAALTT